MNKDVFMDLGITHTMTNFPENWNQFISVETTFRNKSCENLSVKPLEIQNLRV